MESLQHWILSRVYRMYNRGYFQTIQVLFIRLPCQEQLKDLIPFAILENSDEVQSCIYENDKTT